MSLNRISSALFLSLMWLLFLPFPIAPVPDSSPTPTSAAAAASSQTANTTLLFDSGLPGSSLRNCSCSTHVRDCDEALANLLCNCHTVPRSALPPAGLRESERLTVWFRDPWVLQELLNRSTVGHLHLSFCGENLLDTQYLALFGLRTLRIYSATPGAPHASQEITVSPVAGGMADEMPFSTYPLDLEPLSPSSIPSSSITSSSVLHVTFLDVALLNGLSALKAYSVVGPAVPTLPQQFPNLPLPFPLPLSAPPDGTTDTSDQTPEHQQRCVLTFIY
ncbi:uncharacterized protein C21orf62-like [Lampris incognitus]|uniref:uncharacterized protein C21orf62-like n=1 Tax=Lampris incognitus TaxID=2546036 RepID=UPI0024B5AD7D|nr:uncharacterized protein C21orf62-like [Lampris incognitus]XP_056146026.1 uncharacterized protein C21orf62-like [Lampris incognitus]